MVAKSVPKSAMLKLAFPGLTDVPLLQPTDVAKLTEPILDLLSKQADQRQDLGDITILSYNNHAQYETFLRLAQWAKHGAYTPFLSTDTTKLLVRRHGETTDEVYEPRKHENDVAYTSTDDTYMCFTTEVKLLMLGIRSKQKELQAYATRNIMFRYPIYARELLWFLDALARCGIDSLSGLDPKLAIAVKTRIVLVKEQLTADNDLPSILRRLVKPRAHLAALVPDMDSATVDKVLETCAPFDATALLEAFVKTHLTNSMSSTSAATSEINNGRTAPPVASHPETAITAPRSVETARKRDDHDATHAIYFAIGEHRILITPSAGYGTLRRDRHGAERVEARNKDFQFEKGEVLVQSSSARFVASGSRNIIVENCYGEIGEVYGNLQFVPLQHALEKVYGTSRSDYGALRSEHPSSFSNGDADSRGRWGGSWSRDFRSENAGSGAHAHRRRSDEAYGRLNGAGPRAVKEEDAGENGGRSLLHGTKRPREEADDLLEQLERNLT
ncbi:hypothetical protein LTR95_008878 [Oleoguttula sp. CCFEE 5521]